MHRWKVVNIRILVSVTSSFKNRIKGGWGPMGIITLTPRLIQSWTVDTMRTLFVLATVLALGQALPSSWDVSGVADHVKNALYQLAPCTIQCKYIHFFLFCQIVGMCGVRMIVMIVFFCNTRDYKFLLCFSGFERLSGECRTGNLEKLSNSHAKTDQAINSAFA